MVPHALLFFFVITHHACPFVQHRLFVAIDLISENHHQKHIYAEDNRWDCHRRCLPFF